MFNNDGFKSTMSGNALKLAKDTGAMDVQGTGAPKIADPIPFSLRGTIAEIDKAIAANESMLAGELSDEQKETIAKAAAEATGQKGLGIGKMAERLTARDFGISSIQMIQSGIQNQAALASEKAKLQTSEFQAEMQVASFKESVRQLNAQIEESQRSFQLDLGKLSLSQEQSYWANEMEVNKLLVATTELRQNVPLNFARLEGDHSGNIDAGLETYDNLLDQLMKLEPPNFDV